jgi:hypothetical protein
MICSRSLCRMTRTAQTCRSGLPYDAAIAARIADIRRARKIRWWANSHIAGQSGLLQV